MKKTFVFLTLVGLIVSGCSKTWSGIKQDSHEIWMDTQDAIHEATAPSVKEKAINEVTTPRSDSSRRIVVPNNVAPVEQSVPVIETAMDSSK